VTRERVAHPTIALSTVAVALTPTGIITTISAVLVRGLPIAARTAAERPRIVVIALARSDVGLPRVVITIAVVGGASVRATRRMFVALIVARVVVARITIEHAALR
jgi:hypothetical protein